MIAIGQKFQNIVTGYTNQNQKKALIGEFLKFIEVEKAKQPKITKKEKVKLKKKTEILKKEVEEKVEEIRVVKKEAKRIAKLQPPKLTTLLKLEIKFD